MMLPSFRNIAVVACLAVPTLGQFTVNETAVKEHFDKTQSLIENEKKLRQDYPFRQNLSSIASRADEIVASIRQDEIDNFWRKPGLANKEDEMFAGMMFAKARPYITKTKMWDVVRKMPKGSLLHGHWSAMVSYETIIAILLDTEGMAISSTQDLSMEEYRQNAVITITHNSSLSSDSSNLQDLSSSKYIPNTPILLSDAASTYPGGPKALTSFLASKATLSPKSTLRHDLGVDEVWREFDSLFANSGSFLLYEPVFRKYLQALLKQLVDDKIYWAELRGALPDDMVPEGGVSGDEGQRDPDLAWRIAEEEIAKFKESDDGKDFWGLRFIWSQKRTKDQARTVDGMQNLLRAKTSRPNLISGFDLVGQEDVGRTLRSHTPELLWLSSQETLAFSSSSPDQTQQQQNLSIPFFLHAGETLGTGNATDLNLFDALSFPSTRRIGHGFSLYKHPEAMRLAKEQKVLIEVCPISHEVLRLTTDILHHPSLPALMSQGVPLAISNDDPAMLGQDGPWLSWDFYQSLQGVESLGLGGLGAMAQNSVRWSSFEDQSDEDWKRGIDQGAGGSGIKAQRIREWDDRWEEFCQWVVEQYGEKYPPMG